MCGSLLCGNKMETKTLKDTCEMHNMDLDMQVSKLREDHKGKKNNVREEPKNLGNIDKLAICHLDMLSSEC